MALIMPFILLVVFALVDFGFVMHGYIMVTQAAREGARAGAFGDSDAIIREVVLESATTLAPDRLSVDVSPAGERQRGEAVSVTVTYAHNTVTPGLHQLWPTINVQATVAMQTE